MPGVPTKTRLESSMKKCKPHAMYDAAFPGLYDDHHYRLECVWSEFINFVIDIFFLVPGIIVAGTLIRAPVAFSKIRKSFNDRNQGARLCYEDYGTSSNFSFRSHEHVNTREIHGRKGLMRAFGFRGDVRFNPHARILPLVLRGFLYVPLSLSLSVCVVVCVCTSLARLPAFCLLSH